jgi:heme-degrading monooxygenase HmoA
VIIRVWTAHASPVGAGAYADHLRTEFLPTVSKVDGYIGARLLTRDTGDDVEIAVVTYWQSREAMRNFAGDDPDRAVVAAEAKALLTRFDERVWHYEVVLQDGAIGGDDA